MSAKRAGETAADSIGEAAKPIREQVGLLAKLRSELDGQKKARENAFDPADVKRLNKEIAETEKQLKGLETLGTKGGGIKSFFGGAADFVKGGLIVGAIDQIGSAIVDTAGEVAGLVREFERFQVVVGTSTGLTGQALTQQTAQLTAASQAFGQDQEKLLIATNSVAKQFGISQQEALGLIEEGFIKGADANSSLRLRCRVLSREFSATRPPIRSKNSGFASEK
jgi:hypothetical protein